jgi:uncharacterized membrane protein
MSETITEKADEVKEKVTSGGNGPGLAGKILIPAAAGIGTLAATYAATKAPSLVREKVLPRLEQKGSDELAEVGKDAASKASGGGGLAGVAGKAAGVLTKGGGGDGGKKTRRLPIQRWTDVAVPLDTAYEKWTQFEEYPKFMHRVLSVEEQDDNRIAWEEKIWFSKREWEGEILERSKNDRIVWKTVKGTSHTGVVSFHKLDRKLTRVMVTVDFHPAGMMEKMASGLRFVKRAVQADLARFKAYAELGEAEGAEYTQESTTGSGEGGDEEKGREEGDEKGREESKGNGNGSSRASSNGHGDPEELEEARRDRAERRQQRRS